MRNIKQKIIITSFLVICWKSSLSLALCYDMEKEITCGSSEYPNQAGDYPEAIAPLIKQANGLVFDSVNNRLWSPCSKIDCSTPHAMDWHNAQQFCQNFTLEQKKWRLPTIVELNSLLVFQPQQTKINLSLFPDGQPTSYWTNNTSLTFRKSHHKKAWFIHFANGSIFDAPKTDKHLVRCVTDSE